METLKVVFLSFISLVGDYATKDSIMTNGLTLILNRNFIRISKEMLLGQSISESILLPTILLIGGTIIEYLPLHKEG